MRRLVGAMRPERLRLGGMVLLGIVSVVFVVIGPRVLGHATNIIFDGVFSKRIPAGTTKAQAVAYARAHGQGRYADMMQGMTLHPGHGIDFHALALTLLLAVCIYLASAVFGWGQQFLTVGIAQRTVYRLRRAADEKLGRLPLRYFDDHAPRRRAVTAHERPRQHRHVAAAVDHHAHHVGAHHRRRAHHDVPDQPVAGCSSR